MLKTSMLRECRLCFLPSQHETDVDFNRALQIFSELAQSYKERGVGLYFVHMRKSQLDAFMNIGIHHIVSTPSLIHDPEG